MSTFNVLTLVLVCEYFKVLTALSLAIQTARLWRGGPEPGRWTAGPGRLRQLGPPPNVKPLPVEQMDPTTFIPLCDCLEDGGPTMFISAAWFYIWSLDPPYCKTWSLEIYYCKTITVCNKWCAVISIYYVSQKWYFWDCDVWHNRRHLDLKIRVLTSWYQSHCLTLGAPS